MLNLLGKLVKGNLKKDILAGDHCRVVVVNAPEKNSMCIGKEAIAYYLDSRLYLQGKDFGVLRTSTVIADNVTGCKDGVHFITRNSEYVINRL